MEDEQAVIIVAGAKFAIFFKNNAITLYNDALCRYLEYLISAEEDKVKERGSKVTLEGLKKHLETYNAEVDILKAAMASGQQGVVSIQEVNKQLDMLYALEINGEQIKNLLTNVTYAGKLSYKEKPFQPPTTKPQPSGSNYGPQKQQKEKKQKSGLRNWLPW